MLNVFWSPFLLRSFSPLVCAADARCGHPLVLPGAGSWSGHPTGQHRSVEVHLPQACWDRLLQLCGNLAVIKPPGTIKLSTQCWMYPGQPGDILKKDDSGHEGSLKVLKYENNVNHI